MQEFRWVLVDLKQLTKARWPLDFNVMMRRWQDDSEGARVTGWKEAGSSTDKYSQSYGITVC